MSSTPRKAAAHSEDDLRGSAYWKETPVPKAIAEPKMTALNPGFKLNPASDLILSVWFFYFH